MRCYAILLAFAIAHFSLDLVFFNFVLYVEHQASKLEALSRKRASEQPKKQWSKRTFTYLTMNRCVCYVMLCCVCLSPIFCLFQIQSSPALSVCSKFVLWLRIRHLPLFFVLFLSLHFFPIIYSAFYSISTLLSLLLLSVVHFLRFLSLYIHNTYVMYFYNILTIVPKVQIVT